MFLIQKKTDKLALCNKEPWKLMCWCVFELQLEQSCSASRPGLSPFSLGKSPLLCLSVWSRWLVLNRLAFSTSKQPHKCTSFALKYVFLKRLTRVYAAVSRTGRLFGNLTRDSPPQCGLITLCCRSVLKNSRGGGNSTQAAQHRRLPCVARDIKVSVYFWHFIPYIVLIGSVEGLKPSGM